MYEAIKAADTLASAGFNIRIMDLFTINQQNWPSEQTHSAACGGRLVTVEYHYPEGGLNWEKPC